MVEQVLQDFEDLRVQADATFHEWLLQCEQLAGTAGVNPPVSKHRCPPKAQVQCSTLQSRGVLQKSYISSVHGPPRSCQIIIRFAPPPIAAENSSTLLIGGRESSKDHRSTRPAEGGMGREFSMPSSLRCGTDALAEEVAERTAGEGSGQTTCSQLALRAVPEIILGGGAQALFCPVEGGCFVDNVSEGWGGNLSWGGSRRIWSIVGRVH